MGEGILSPKKRPVCHRRKIESDERNGKRVSGFEIRFFFRLSCFRKIDAAFSNFKIVQLFFGKK